MHVSWRDVWKELTTFRWKPSRDLVAVAVSWLLVTAALYTATVIVGDKVAGGLAYFGLYGLVTALLFGTGIPL